MLIYKITNKINSKIYIGQTVGTLADRWSDHSRPARGKNTARSAISAAIKLYGKDNFTIEIVTKASSLVELNELEQRIIKEYGCLAPNGYNLLKGGDNRECHPETKKKISATLKGRPIKNRMNGAPKGRKVSEERKARISKTMTGVAQPWKYKPVLCNETKEIFESVNKAAESTGIERTAMLYLLRSGGKNRKTGHTYSYINKKAA